MPNFLNLILIVVMQSEKKLYKSIKYVLAGMVVLNTVITLQLTNSYGSLEYKLNEVSNDLEVAIQYMYSKLDSNGIYPRTDKEI